MKSQRSTPSYLLDLCLYIGSFFKSRALYLFLHCLLFLWISSPRGIPLLSSAALTVPAPPNPGHLVCKYSQLIFCSIFQIIKDNISLIWAHPSSSLKKNFD
uniref:Uncharacterized protein n=1 Tax=Junco hyemalis TaxID=40217 RepID=A0A8C5IJB5_JUNHY